MAIEFTVKIISDETLPADLSWCASANGTGGTDAVFAGYGRDAYSALHDLINNFEEAEIYRED